MPCRSTRTRYVTSPSRRGQRRSGGRASRRSARARSARPGPAHHHLRGDRAGIVDAQSGDQLVEPREYVVAGLRVVAREAPGGVSTYRESVGSSVHACSACGGILQAEAADGPSDPRRPPARPAPGRALVTELMPCWDQARLVLVAGGWVGPGGSTATTEIFDAASGSFTPGPDLP